MPLEAGDPCPSCGDGVVTGPFPFGYGCSRCEYRYDPTQAERLFPGWKTDKPYPDPGPKEEDWNFTSPEGWDFDKGETCPSCEGQMIDPNFPSKWCTTCEGTGMVGPHLSRVTNRTRKQR